MFRGTCSLCFFSGSIIDCYAFRQVALQFPGDLMSASVTVLQLLQKSTTAEIVILADTSYGRSIAFNFVVSCLSPILYWCFCQKSELS